MKPLLIENTPHIRAAMTTQRIMRLVMLALLPASVMSVVQFGWRAAMLIVFCTVFSVACEGVCRNLMKREQTVRDGSAALTGLLLALNLPVTIPLWEAGLGCVIAIALVKQLFGGLGQNFANPAITARLSGRREARIVRDVMGAFSCPSSSKHTHHAGSTKVKPRYFAMILAVRYSPLLAVKSLVGSVSSNCLRVSSSSSKGKDILKPSMISRKRARICLNSSSYDSPAAAFS